MKTRLLWLVALCAGLVGCSSMKVHQDWDQQADFLAFKTYAWHDSEDSLQQSDPFAHQRFIAAVDRQLAAQGLAQVSENPDVLVSYQSKQKERVSLDTSYMGTGWGYGPSWGRAGMGTSTTRVRTYNVGTLVLDIWDAREQRLVWRGTVTDTVSEDPQKNAEKIKQAAQSLFEHYPPPLQ